MEKTMIKAVIYSFISALLLGTLLYSDVKSITYNDNVTTTFIIPLREYIFKLIRFATVISIITVALYLGFKWKSQLEFLKNFKGFVVVLVVILIVLMIY